MELPLFGAVTFEIQGADELTKQFVGTVYEAFRRTYGQGVVLPTNEVKGFFDDINRAEPPSLNDVMKSLGDFAELKLAV